MRWMIACALILGSGCALVAGLEARDVAPANEANGGNGAGGTGAGDTDGGAGAGGGPGGGGVTGCPEPPAGCDVGTCDCDGDGSCQDVLGDEDNCGTCGRSCFGGGCAAGKCGPRQLAVSAVVTNNGQGHLALDDDYVYWTTPPPMGGVFRVSKTAGSAREDLAVDVEPHAIAVDDTHVYWTSEADPYAVRRTPKDGTGMGMVEDVYIATDTMGMLATDAVYLYLAAGNANPNRVVRFTKNAMPIWNADPIDVDSGFPFGLTVADGLVFFTRPVEGHVARSDGTSEMVLYNMQGQVRYVAASGQFVFWTIDTPSGAVMQGTIDGALLPPITLASNEDNPNELRADDTHVYWVTAGDTTNGAVKRVPIGGGEVEILVTPDTELHSLVMDDVAVYYGSEDGVFKLAK